MRKGTTPTFTFELPYGVEMVAAAKVTFYLHDKVVLEKYLSDCNMIGNTLTLKLTQEETFIFECDGVAKVQLRVLETTGDARASDVYIFHTEQCLDDEVLICE